MSAQMQISLLHEGGLDLHTGLTFAHSSNPSDGQWMDKNQEFEKELEASVTTQCEDNDANAKVLQNKNRNGNKRVYECPVCLKRFGAPSKLKRHCLIHTDQRPFQCSICCRAFRERSHLKVHLRAHTNPSSPDAVTPDGNGIFPVSKSSDLTCTLQLKKKSGHQCEICLKKFSFPSKLNRHLFVHFDVKAYTCTICRKSFKQAYYLHKHLEVHTEKRNSNSRLYSISQKHKAKLPTPGTLQRTNNCRLDGGDVCLPQILDTLETKKYECQSKLNQNVTLTKSNSSIIEIKSSDTLKNTEMQMTTSSPIYPKRTHKGVNQCSICLKNFPYPSKLARHVLSHTDKRPFKCHVCLKSFRYRWHLQYHVRIHKNKGQNIIAGHLEQDHTDYFSNAVKSEEDDVQISLQDGAEDQDQNVVKENMMNQKLSGDCSDSGVYLQTSLLNVGRLDLPTEQSSAYSPKPSEAEMMEENQESAKEKKASVAKQNEDKYRNAKVLQSKSCNGNKKVYDCPVCHKRFGAPSKLKRHCLVHTDQRPFQCSICCRAFRERSHLKVHNRTHTNPEKQRTRSLQSYKDNSVPCNQTSKSSLKPFPENPTAQNDTCSANKQKTGTSDPIENTAATMGVKVTKGHFCPLCLKCFNAPSKLKRHILIHTGQRPFTCSVCPKTFREKSHLKAHKCVEDFSLEFSSTLSDWQVKQNTVKHKANEGVGSTIIDDSNDVQGRCSSPHAVTNAGKRIFPVSKSSDLTCTLQLKKKSGHQCEICLKKFSFPSKLTRHMFVHFDSKPYTCTICRKSFKQAYYLHKHLEVHTEKRNSNSRLCRLRHKHKAKFPVPGALQHTNNCRLDGGDVCLPQILDTLETKKHECQSKLNQNVTLTESNSSIIEIKSSDTLKNTEMQMTTSSPIYPKRTHKGVNQCSICLKNFPYPSKLARHVLSHTDKRPFKCHVCLKSFRYRWHLQYHVRIHKNKGQNIIAGNLKQDRAVYFSNAVKSEEEEDVQISLQDGAEDSTKVHKDQNTVMESQKVSGDCSDSGVYLRDSLINKEGLDLYTGLSYAYSSKLSQGPWMEENQESEEGQEASVTIQTEDNDLNAKVSQNFNGSKRVYHCPVCHKHFGAPSKLKRHYLIHTNQRPFQCSICCRAFRERSHLKVHVRTHNIPEKQRTPLLQSYRENNVPCNQALKSRSQPFPKQPTAQGDTKSTDKEKSTVHQEEIMVIENMASQIISGDCSESDAYLQDSLLKNKKGLDLHTGLSSAYVSKQWMEKNLETEEKQEASVTTQSEDNDVNVKMLQSMNSDGNKRVYDCPVCNKRFGAPSKLKRHYLIHTNQRPFQCSICCRAFREHSHLKVHVRTHNIPEKQRTPLLQSYRDNRVSCNRASKSKLKPSPKYLTAHNDTTSTNNQKATMQQDHNVLTEDTLSQKMSRGCSDSGVYLSKSSSPLENVENKVVFWCNNKSVWSLMHKSDILLDGKEASDIVPFGRVSDCPPKTDSSLRHCASESRTEEKWAHHMDDTEDGAFVDSDSVMTQCGPDSYKPSFCQYQQKPDVPRIPEVVVELEDFEDAGERFIKPPHALPFCPDCCQSFRTIKNLYAHNCANRYPEEEMKKSHQCDICFKFFNAPSKLKRHSVTHTGQRPFQCTQCQKSFTQSHHLKTHMLSHT